MSDVKKKLLEEIESKIRKSRELKARKASSSIVDDYVLEFIKQVESYAALALNQTSWQTMVALSISGLESQVRQVDPSAKIEVRWHTPESEPPQVNAVIIRWSKTYQDANKCEPELFVDLVSLMLK